MEQVIVFNKENNIRSFNINPEDPFFKIIRIEIPSIPKGSRNIGGLAPDFRLTSKVTNSTDGVDIEVIGGISPYLTPNHTEAKFEVNKILAWKTEHITVELEYESDDDRNDDILIHYTQFDKKVELKDPFEDFELHIKSNDNAKVLFSAPFGQGKTTFLNHFFNTNKSRYEVFQLFPVNYAVSHNEDIFKYIKAEILFQLMEKDVEFDKIKFKYLDTAPAFFKKNAHNILSPFISMLPVIGKSASDIYKNIYKLAEEYLDYHSKIQVDDKDKALKFIHELYEKEGSIFEDNFYSQLIRQLLEQQKQKSKKKNILIIDDIDRMDPDHIFRIFNVFAANFDSRDFANGYTNKFGFDKVILVCDHSNIRNLFAHRYGNTSEFNGYLSKYYSKTPYHYDNKKAIETLTKKLTYNDGEQINSTIGMALIAIVQDLIWANELTLRDLLRLLKFNFYKNINEQGKIYPSALNVRNSDLFYFNIISFLNKIFDSQTLSEKFMNCRKRAVDKGNFNYNSFTKLGFIPLLTGVIKNGETVHFNFKGRDMTFRIGRSNDLPLRFDYYVPEDITLSNNEENFYNAKDFWDVLALNVEKYIMEK